MKEFFLTQMQNAIADKRRIVENMHREEEMGGWRVDWNEAYEEANFRYEKAEEDYLSLV